jgi:hypothetical protein
MREILVDGDAPMMTPALSAAGRSAVDTAVCNSCALGGSSSLQFGPAQFVTDVQMVSNRVEIRPESLLLQIGEAV